MSPQHRKTCDTAVTGRGVASGPEFQNRTCTCDTRDCDTAVRPLPVSHPICEEPGHMAQDHKKYEAKKGRTWGNTSPPQKKSIKEIHALLQELSPQETKELLVLQSTNQKKEEKEEKEDDEDF